MLFTDKKQLIEDEESFDLASSIKLSHSYSPLIEAMYPDSIDLNYVLSTVNKLAHTNNSATPPNPPVKFICAQGGGAKGAAYIGTIKGMEETGTLQNLEIVAGASAGAINALLMGLGLTSEQIESITHNLDFQDLNDYSDSYVTSVVKALNHSGENFYNIARMLIEHITGDPDITFGELRELCKKNTSLKQMIFKGTNLKNGASQTFSAEETPNVRICDAVRASMSFPGAFEPWKVYERGVDKQLKLFGLFTDGGVLCNYPIEVFNEQKYEDPHYKRQDTTTEYTTSSIARNPCSVGLSLCSVNKLDDEITPFTPRLKSIVSNKEKKQTLTVEEELAKDKWTFTQMATVLLQNKLGLNPEDVVAKHKTYNHQTVQIYTEEVGTLEFKLSPEKQKLIEESGYHAWLQWFKKEQQADKPYENEEKVDFSIDLVVKDERGHVVSFPTGKQLAGHFKSLFIEYFAQIHKEALSCSQNPINSVTLTDNQRIKFYSHLLITAMDVYRKHYKLRKGDEELAIPELDVVIKDAFEQCVKMQSDIQRKRQEHFKHAQLMVDESLSIELIKGLLKSKNPADQQKALRFFKGKLSRVFNLVEDSKGELLGLAAQSGNVEVLEGMLNMLEITEKMYSQTNRRLRYPLAMLLNESGAFSLYSYASQAPNAKDVIGVLLKHKINPLRTDENGLNAFHYAIIYDNYEMLLELVNQYGGQTPKLNELRFGPFQQPLSHFIIQNASQNMLDKLIKNSKLLDSLIDKNIVNNEGVTCKQLAAHMITSSPKWEAALQKQNSKEMLLMLCASEVLKTDLLTHVQLQSKSYDQAVQESQSFEDKREKTIVEITKNITLVEKLTPKECLSILQSLQNDGDNFLVHCAKNPDLANVGVMLCSKAYSDKSTYPGLLALVESKFKGKTPLYIACESNNSVFITYLRSSKYDARVNDAGPLESPSALTAAAKAGACEAVVALILSKPTLGGYVGGNTISRSIGDSENRTVIHWLAQSTNPKAPEALYNALQTGAKSFYQVSSQTDAHGHSPLYYILNNQKALEILSYLVKKGVGTTRKTSWYLDDYFDLNSKRPNGYTDLEYAFISNPKVGQFIAENLRDNSIVKSAMLTAQVHKGEMPLEHFSIKELDKSEELRKSILLKYDQKVEGSQEKKVDESQEKEQQVTSTLVNKDKPF